MSDPRQWALRADVARPATPVAAPVEPVPFWSAVSRNMIDAGQTRRAGAREEAFNARMWERHREAERRLGRRLPLSDTLNGEPTAERDSLKRLMDRLIPVDRINAAILGRPGSLSDDAYEAELDALRVQNPGLLDDVPSRAQLRESLDRNLTAIRRRATEGVEGLGGGVAAFAGQTIGGFLSDPAQVGVAVATGGLGAGRSLLTRMAAQAAAGAGAETLEIGGRVEDAARYGGPDYTPGEAALDIAFGAAGGAGFEAVAAGGGAALRAARARLATSPEPADRGISEAIGRLLDDEATIGAADDFDAARAALDRGAPLPRVEPDRDLDSLFANQPEGDLLRPVAGLQPASAGGLQAAEYRGRLIHAGRFDPMTVEADAARFQYKAEGDAEGVTGRLRGVERWDATASGKAILFEDTDGRIIVADGHQRRGLARRLAEQGWEDAQLDGYLFRARDGWTDREVRVVAALKNIREGSGAVMDAAKLFREAPQALQDRSLPITGDFMHQARQLASLSDDGFRAVVNGVVPERYAAVIGEQAADRPELHGDLVELIRRGEPRSVEGARALVQEGLLDDFLKSEGRQMDLFGGLPRESTVIARGRIREAVLAALRKDERLNAALVRNAEAIEAGGNILARSDNEARLAVDRAASELVSRLALRSGEMGEAFSDAAAAVTKGETSPGAAAKGLVQRIRAAVAAGERLDAERAEVLNPSPPAEQALESAGLFDDVAGMGQRGQLEPKPEDARIEADGPPTEDRLDFAARTEAEARTLVESERAAVEADRLALEELKDQAEVNRPLADTRGRGVQYHGARGEVGDLSEGYYNPDNIYGGWETFYTTDATDIASGYGRKRATAKVYQVREREAVRFFDMEEERTEAEWRKFLGITDESHDFDQFALEQAVAEHGGRANLRQVMDEYRASGREFDFSKDDVQELFSSFTDLIQAAGFGGMRHIGGLKTNRAPHEVKIYLRPHEQIELQEITPARASIQAEAQAQIEAASARLAEREAGLASSERQLADLQENLARMQAEARPAGLFDDLSEVVSEERALDVLRRCAPGGANG